MKPPKNKKAIEFFREMKKYDEPWIPEYYPSVRDILLFTGTLEPQNENDKQSIKNFKNIVA